MQRTQTSLVILLALTARAVTACGSDQVAAPVGPPDGPVALALQDVATGLTVPLYLTAPAGDPRLFIVE